MTRPKGAKNIVHFIDRDEIDATSTASILHLASQADETPLEQFRSLLRHEGNFLKWIDSRHNDLMKAKASNSSSRGPKDATYRKYKWYAEQNSLLEAINAFETFYKDTFMRLGAGLRSYVASGAIKGNVSASTVWSASQSAEPAALVFGAQLFHNLSTVDEASNMLVGAKRYQPNNAQSPMASKVRSIQAIFQIRHTLSHNQGRITEGDAAKFEALGYAAAVGDAIDPASNHLGQVVRSLLLDEANEYTKWVRGKTVEFLAAQAAAGFKLQKKDLVRVEAAVGSDQDLANLPWS